MRSNFRRRNVPGKRRPAKRSNRYVKKTKKSVLKRTINKILSKKLETKYVAYEVDDGYVHGNINGGYGGTAPGDSNFFKNIIPPVLQAGTPTTTLTSAHTRIGNRISPVKMITTVQYYFQYGGLQGTQDLSGVNLNGCYEVRQVCVAPREIGSFPAYDSLSQTAKSNLQAKLLEVGDGTTVAANSQFPMNLNYPVSNENYTVLSGNKKFIMEKNSGLFNNAPSSYPFSGGARTQNTIRFRTKLPKVLIYDENNSQALPMNTIALWGCYAGILNNQRSGAASATYDDILQTTVLTGLPKHPILRWNLRTELWYKDA